MAAKSTDTKDIDRVRGRDQEHESGQEVLPGKEEAAQSVRKPGVGGELGSTKDPQQTGWPSEVDAYSSIYKPTRQDAHEKPAKEEPGSHASTQPKHSQASAGSACADSSQVQDSDKKEQLQQLGQSSLRPSHPKNSRRASTGSTSFSGSDSSQVQGFEQPQKVGSASLPPIPPKQHRRASSASIAFSGYDNSQVQDLERGLKERRASLIPAGPNHPRRASSASITSSGSDSSQVGDFQQLQEVRRVSPIPAHLDPSRRASSHSTSSSGSDSSEMRVFSEKSFYQPKEESNQKHDEGDPSCSGHNFPSQEKRSDPPALCHTSPIAFKAACGRN